MSEVDPDPVAVARGEVGEVVGKLKQSDKRLRAVHQNLVDAAAKVEKELGDEEDNDVLTEIRSVIECVLADSLGPAIRDLETASLYGVRNRARSGGREDRPPK